MAEICSMACVGASPQVHIIFSCKSDSAITNVHPFVCPSVLKTPFNLHLSILTLHLSIIILHFATSKLFSLFQSHPLSFNVLDAEWVARQIQQIPPLPRIHAWDCGWCSSIWSVKFVNLIMFIWKLTLVRFRVTKTYRSASR